MTEIVSFGAWTQKRRKVFDLTRNQLADLIGCSPVTIKKIERDERRPSQEMAYLLAKHLKIPEAERKAFVQMARGQYVPSLMDPDVFSSDVTPTMPKAISTDRSTLPPQLTTFVGREPELAALETLLAESETRLVTLVGPGGIGKTRTALAAAERLMSAFTAGVFFIPFARSNPTDADDMLDLLVATIASELTLSLYGQDTLENQLIAYLKSRQMLLILDNFEYLLVRAAGISRLLQNAPDLKILVTSRERLNLQEEWLFTLTGLTYPAPDMGWERSSPQSSLSARGRKASPAKEGNQGEAFNLQDFSALVLFDQRIRQHTANFDLEANAEAVSQICHLVEGMPLALELAASWGSLLSLPEIVTEIQQSLDFLETSLLNVPHRHQSIRAVFDACWRRMSDQERTVFSRLSVFRGGFTRQATQAIAGISLQMLNTLLSKSLIRTNKNRDRYEIHELLRQYGAEQLAAMGQTDLTRQKHSDYYLVLLAEREVDLMGEAQLAALNEIEADFENVRAAWQWGASHRNVVQIGAALQGFYLFCTMRNQQQAGIELSKQALAYFRDKENSDFAYLYGRLLCRRWSKVTREEIRQWTAEEFVEIDQFLTTARIQQDEAEWAFGAGLLAAKAHDMRDYATALAISEARLEIYQRLEDRYCQANVWDSIAYWASTLGQVDRFRDATQHCLALNRAIGNQTGIASGLILLGSYWFFYAGDLSRAKAILEEAIAIDAKMGNHSQRIFSEAIVGWLYLFQGAFDRAQDIGQAAFETAQDLNAPLGQAMGLSLLGAFEAMQGRYETGMHHAAQAQGLTTNVVATALVAYSFVTNALGLGDYTTIRPVLIQFLTYTLSIQAPMTLIVWLPLIALTLARSDHRLKRAVELLALTRAHPGAADLGFLDRWSLLAKLAAELKSTLPPEDYAAAEIRGGTLDLAETGTQLLQELSL